MTNLSPSKQTAAMRPSLTGAAGKAWSASLARAGKLALAASCVLALAACTTTGEKRADNAKSTPAATAADPAAAASPEQYKEIPLQSLYALIVADIAGQRKRFDVALLNYLEQTVKTRDVGIARHTTELAEALKAENVALKTATVWADASADDPKAMFSAAIHHARANKLGKATNYMQRSLELGGASRLGFIAALAEKSTRATQENLLERISALRESYPSADVHLATGILQKSLGQPNEALASLRESLNKDSDNLTAIVAEVRLLQQLGEQEQAFTRLEKLLAESPNNKALKLQYARLLTQTDMPAAVAQFEELVAEHPEDNHLRFTLALVYRENENLDQARAMLGQLYKEGFRADSSLYYRALIEEESEQIDTAVKYYEEVPVGKLFIQAQSRRANILAEQDKLDTAVTDILALEKSESVYEIELRLLAAQLLSDAGKLQRGKDLLNESLQRHPEESNLLYARSMLFEKQRDLVNMERDLRQMLKLDPDNATALNALGYTLTVHTKRYDEAYTLIARALEIKPNDPAILDSMGWILFLQGKVENALEYLEKAHAQFPDAEVAAHLGEALWTAGEQKRAREVWGKALKAQPENDVLKKTLERFPAK